MAHMACGEPYWLGERLLSAQRPLGADCNWSIIKIRWSIILNIYAFRDVRWAADYLKWTYIWFWPNTLRLISKNLIMTKKRMIFHEKRCNRNRSIGVHGTILDHNRSNLLPISHLVYHHWSTVRILIKKQTSQFFTFRFWRGPEPKIPPNRLL